jgi:hypothetical protein
VSRRSNRRVDANPTKDFFISMLVRDIELFHAIADLVDNSIDGARRLGAGGDGFDGLWVRMTTSKRRFRIEDNCGGIPADLARNYAFTFGRKKGFPAIPGSVGQFGVGMKRALFKLGTHFRIASTADTSRFVLDVDVPTWAAEADKDWSFEFEELEENLPEVPRKDRGTTITVDKLHPLIAEDFQDGQVLKELEIELRQRHERLLERGLRIELNGLALQSRQLKLLASDLIRPIHRRLTILRNGSRVEMQVYAGLSREREEISAAGWYVYCNDRLLLNADQSALTGWVERKAGRCPTSIPSFDGSAATPS